MTSSLSCRRGRWVWCAAFAALVAVGCGKTKIHALEDGGLPGDLEGGAGAGDGGHACVAPPEGSALEPGAACGCSADCASNFCVDGVCCNSACEEACKTCAAPTAKGICTFVSSGAAPRDPSTCAATSPTTCGLDGTCDGAGACRKHPLGTECAKGHCDNGAVTGSQACDGEGRCRPAPAVICAPYQCDDATAACFDACDQNGQCVAGHQCDKRSCGPKMKGAKCTVGAECSSGFCADSVCCNVACEGGCVSCASSGRAGTCWPVDRGRPDPRAVCKDSGASSCGTTGTCDGFGGCEKYAAETQCLAPMCTGLVRRNLPGVCDGAGACKPPGVASCSPNLCVAGACKTACLVDGDCEPGHACTNGSCGKIADGNACAANADCANAHCVDGVCCDTGCAGACQSCSLVATLGKCTPIVAGNTDPRGLCKDLGAGKCATNGRCDGTGACQKYPVATVCGPETCTAGVYTPASSCNASGVCEPPSARPCNPYVCNGSACFNACTNNSNCLAPQTCDVNNQCGKKPLGASCSAGPECQSSFCAQGVCCNSGCSGSCQSCELPGTLGACTNVPTGSADPAGICRDAGVASCGTTGKCQAGVCQRYAPGTVCKDPTCSAATNLSTAASTCDGAGVCTTPAAVSCGSFKCGATTCKTSCTSTTTVADCVAPAVCGATSGLCGLKANGQPCGGDVECVSSICAQGFCCNEVCTDACRSCAVTGALGTCHAVPAGPSASCAKTESSTCQTNGFCDGTGACQLWASGTECSPQTCVDGVGASTQTFAKACDGLGGCKAPATAMKTCGPAKCKGASCVVACSSPADCWAPNTCSASSTCGPKPNGQGCFGSAECASGACVDGVCCASPSCAACQTCNKTPSSAGTCQNVDKDQPDPLDRCTPRTSCTGLNYTRAPSCTGAGTCGAATFESCSDGDACTTDACRGDTGCSHVAAAGLSCGNMCLPLGSCCTNAECAAPQTCGGGGAANVCGCTPTTCAAQGKNCGMIANGCGQMLGCGDCTGSQVCGGAGVPNVCADLPCAPTNCAAQGKTCGTLSDGCGMTLTCGTCAAPQSCGGGGIANVCGCTPTTCAAQGKNCDGISDGCGMTIACGSCTSPQSCGGGGTPNVCGCLPSTACPADQDCGSASDGCGGSIACGTCTLPATCGGGGTPDVCGCTPLAACPAGQNCDAVSDGCGGTINCGVCTAPQTCGGGGGPNVCG